MTSPALELKSLLQQSPAWSVAVAESVTAGNVQARIASASGASTYFRGGVTAYTLTQKVQLLGVDRDEARRANCVSAEVARQMARGACVLFDADVAVATTGYAEPSRENDVPAPFAWWAVARRVGRSFQWRHGRVECLGANRIQAQAIVADAALAELVLWLRELRGA